MVEEFWANISVGVVVVLDWRGRRVPGLRYAQVIEPAARYLVDPHLNLPFEPLVAGQ